jgi:hypothetical protein
VADSGLAALDAMIDRMKRLGNGADVAARVARAGAPLVAAALKKTAAAGTTPAGSPWKPKKDGGRPLVNAAAHITVRPAGNFILAQLVGPDVFHHLGLGGKPHRQVIPDSAAIPDGVARAVLEGARKVFLELTQGGGGR